MATSKKAAKADVAGASNKGLRVTAKRASFWRGGHQFGHEPRVIPLDQLTEEQAQLIVDEGAPGGMLIVDEVDVEAPAAAA